MAGVKFKDADLMGMPIRLTVSPRNHQKGVVEMKLRRSAEPDAVPYPQVIARVQATIVQLTDELNRVADRR
jgi:prolyl-tRNA synthetase